MADVLQSVPGFNVSYDRDYDYVGVIGVSLGDANNRILLLVNGHRVNNNLTDAAAVGTDFILDIDLVDQVEIIHGPGAVLYGNNAFLAVINVITRAGKQIKGAEISFDYGAFDTYAARVSYRKVFTNGINWLLSGTVLRQRRKRQHCFTGSSTRRQQNNGIAQNMDGDSFRSVASARCATAISTLEAAHSSTAKRSTRRRSIDLTTFDDPRLADHSMTGAISR